MPAADVSTIKVEFFIAWGKRADGNGQIGVFPQAASLGFGRPELIDANPNRHTKTTGKADGLIKNIPAATKSGIHELVVNGTGYFADENSPITRQPAG